MRKLKYIGLVFLMLPLLMFGEWSETRTFLNTAENVASGATATNETEFTTNKWSIPATKQVVAITITFTGDGSMDGNDIDFFFQISYDGGTTWTSTGFIEIDAASDAAHVSNVVIHTELVNAYGISHIRLWKIVNNDATSNITAGNAYLSY